MKINGEEFKPAGGGITYMKPAELPTSEHFVGVYRGEVPSNFGINYKFVTASGETVVVNGCGSLKVGLGGVALGTNVALKYLGKKKLEKGKNAGKEFHSVEVLLGKVEEKEEDGIPF